MSISGISLFSGSSTATAAAKKSALQQRSTDFASLSQALNSSNLNGAKTAFATLQQDAQKVNAAGGGSPASAQNGAAVQQVKSDAQTLATSLSANNISAAQKAFAALKQHSASQYFNHNRQLRSGSPVYASAAGDYRAAKALSSVGRTLNLSA